MKTCGTLSRVGLLACTASLAVGISGHARAQAGSETRGLEDIIVTAQKREQSLQDVPIAVTAVTSEALAANRIENVADLNSITPGLVVSLSPGGTQSVFYTLRGLYVTGGNAGADRGVGMYIDGVYIGAPTGNVFNMPEIERIEVLRGPQGTLFGRNSTAGAISVVTRQPSGELGLRQRVTVGNRNQIGSITTVDLPKVGPFSALVSYTHSQERGDIRNLGAGTVWDYTGTFGRPTFLKSPKWLGSNNSDAIFASVKAELGDLTMVYRFDHTIEHGTPQASTLLYAGPALRDIFAAQPNQAVLTKASLARPEAVNNAGTVPNRSKVTGHSLTMEYQLSDAVSFKNIAAFRKHYAVAAGTEVLAIGGLVYTGGPLLGALVNPATARIPGAPLQGFLASNETVFKQWSEELQINVTTDLVTFTGGGMYYRMRTLPGYLLPGGPKPAFFSINPNFQVPSTVQPQNSGGKTTDILVQSYAGYGQAEFHVTEALDVVGGLRWTKDRKTGVDRTIVSTLNPNEFQLDYSDDRFTYMVGANYKITPDILTYAKYSTAYVSGGSLSTINYNPEKAKSWEAGIKADLFGRTLRTNLALYSVKYSDLLFNGSTTGNPLLADLLAKGVVTYIANAGDAKTKGVEFEATWAPVRSLVFGGNLAYQDFKYTFLEPFVTAGGTFVVAGRPKWTAALSGQYTSPPLIDEAHISARLDANWRSKMFGPGSSIPNVGAFTWGGAAFTAAERDQVIKAMMNPARWMVNGRLALEDINMGALKGSVALWARNLLNEKATHFRTGASVGVTAYWEPLRSYGVDLSVEF